MEAVTITQITPPELETLIEKSIRKILSNLPRTLQPESDRWFNLPELCEYLPDKPAKATIYGYVSTNVIPFHKGEKKLRFLKSEIDNWLKSNRKKTFAEIAAEADVFLSNQKKRRLK